MAKVTECNVEGCVKPPFCRGMCPSHYKAWRASDEYRPREYPLAPHGTVARYNNRRTPCRCAACTEASAVRKRRYRSEYPDRDKAARDAYEAANKARAAARKKADREANPDKYSARLAAYNATDAGRQNRHMRKLRRRAREFSAEMLQVTPADWRRLLDHYRNRCAYCGASDRPLTREHIIPLARGGRHSIGNLLPVCGSCNYSKADRLLIEWRAWKQALANAS